MKIDVGKAIRELLFVQETIVVPGLGGFISTPCPATVDYVQGTISPPSKKLSFNPNLVINDGVLVHHIQKNEVLTFQEAGKAVDDFVEEVKLALERREIVEIPKLGRLYKDYEHKVRFLPEGVNFNAEAFGLPAVQFTPLVKERPKEVVAPAPENASPSSVQPGGVVATAAESASPVAEAATEPKAAASGSKNQLQRILPWAILAAAIILALGIYILFGRGESGEVLPQERINVKPKAGEGAASAEGDGAKSQPDVATLPPAAGGGQKATPEVSRPQRSIPGNGGTESNAFEPGRKTVFMVVHSFGVKDNATRFAQKLSEEGYTPESKRFGNLYRVGVVFPYNNQQDIEAMRKELARKYDAGPKTEKELEEQEQL